MGMLSQSYLMMMVLCENSISRQYLVLKCSENCHFEKSISGNILEISQLESLETLYLSCNSFHGPLPSNFTQFKDLLSVNLSSNDFEGVVPKFCYRLILSAISLLGSWIWDLEGLALFRTFSIISQNALVGELFSHDETPFLTILRCLMVAIIRFMVLDHPSILLSLHILRLASNHVARDPPEALLQDSSMVLTELDFSRIQTWRHVVFY